MIKMQQPVSKPRFCHFLIKLDRREVDRFGSQAKRSPVHNEQMLCLKFLEAPESLFGIKVRHKLWDAMGIAAQVYYGQIDGKITADFLKAPKIGGIAGNIDGFAGSRLNQIGSA